ncbi:hypothetical protein NE683_13820 [Bariatricus massiliensis]|uniref:Uncharacterized protein n=1 Tax=Bariatricus massiliensis TaxID=1745713 RepID=A0ABS8DIY6_9FIRM|nr:hypothetical protein [Bariatricus massiliensis]MCB7304593.1 hypothetical protein [Bariatricus massiliensis]MCB7374744.1 hypothetical protein [Bariatricus massiliensis]MCB7388129.1 hypothetical protein [Bariatricus massiliensis]MCB7411909.1 hypothetical protein [Bariatricus massiliensis]MCQ5254300.1 hypothetical protein [Bariatricus massiliensis]
MKIELDYFTIDGEFGGNQDWFTNVVMHIGGCAAAAACDTCVYLARRWGMKELYPFDADNLSKRAYVQFSQMMKPFLKPRVRGVCKLWMYTEGFGKYLDNVYSRARAQTGVEYGDGRLSAKMMEFSGTHSKEEAEKFLKTQLDRQLPVPYLMLQHSNRDKFKDFIWHWFLVVGYEERMDGFYIKAATYGEETWFCLSEIWNTGVEEKGGMIGYEIVSAEA